MQFLLLTILAVGLISVGAWLCYRRTRRIREGAEKSREIAKSQEISEPVESGPSAGAGIEDGIKEAPQDLEGERILAEEPSGSAKGKEKTGFSKRTKPASSSAAIEDEAGDAAFGATSESPPENKIGTVQTSGRLSDGRMGHLSGDNEWQSRTIADEGGEEPDTQQQTGDKEEEAQDFSAIDECGGDDVVCVDIAPKVCEKESEADRASGGEFGGDTRVVAERDESGDDARVEPDVTASRVPASREEGLEIAIEADPEADNAPEGEDASAAASGSEEDHPGPVGLDEQMKNADLHPAAKERLSGNVGDSVEGEEKSGGGEHAEAEVPRRRELLSLELHLGTEAEPASEEDEADSKEVSTPAGEEAPTKVQQKGQPAVYRDRRGLRRAAGKAPEKGTGTSSQPAEARLRLMLDPVQRNASLSVILMRPEGFPERIQPLLDGEDPVEAFDDDRYDDLVLSWTRELLSGELRLRSKENHQWLRAARAVHIFSENPAESGMISVGSARTDATHAVICRTEDEDVVRAAAVATGSTSLVSHEHWHGIPDGWAVLSGYCPRHAAGALLPSQFSPLDPGTEVGISLTGGLAIRSTVYAEGSPPRIAIAPLPDGAFVSIGGRPAKQVADGAWETDGWDSPGHHLIDVVPGPSLTYQIIADPAMNGEWQFWDAHPARFGADSHKPWSRAGICGAAVRGPEGETVIAAASLPILIALGERRQAVPLMPRSDAPASVAMMSEAPCFLIAATGLRRKQGRIVWLGSRAKRGSRSSADQHWAETVRSITARRLRLEGAGTDGERVWRNAKQRARRIWRKR